MSFTVIVPFFNGQPYIEKLLDSIPKDIKVIIVDDLSDKPYDSDRTNVVVYRLDHKGYFTGAVNFGIDCCNNDILILNQDTYFSSTDWLKLIETNLKQYAMFGEKTVPHPAWPGGYIHGTFMYVSREVIRAIGKMNEVDYPLWGSTCEWQLRAARAGYKIHPIKPIKGFNHARRGPYGSSIRKLLDREPELQAKLIRTPPEISVLVTCYNHGKYIKDLVGSLVGGTTSLGKMKQQTQASFEVIIVDDASTDGSQKQIEQVVDPLKGISAIYLSKNGGTAKALNVAANAAHGKYLTVLNADDMRETSSLDKLYRAQLKNPHSFIYDDIIAFNNGELRPDIRLGVSDYDFEAMLHQNHVHTGIMLPKTAWAEVGGWPEIMNDGREDWAMNVRLGVNGYCGVRIRHTGYFYRREGQNRTLVNTTPHKREEYLAKIMSLYPDIYKGVRPMSCCGGRQSKSVARRSYTPDVSPGYTILEYIGSNYGSQSWYGPVTHTRYMAGLSHKLVRVDDRDLHSDDTNTPGMLDYRSNGRPMFRRYKQA